MQIPERSYRNDSQPDVNPAQMDMPAQHEIS